MKVTIKEDNGREKVIGTLENGVFSKNVKKSKHLFIKTNSWGVDADYFKTVVEPTCTVVKVRDTEERKTYLTTPQIIAKHGEYKHFRPHRAQIFLSLRYWVTSDKFMSADEVKQELIDNHIRI